MDKVGNPAPGLTSSHRLPARGEPALNAVRRAPLRKAAFAAVGVNARLEAHGAALRHRQAVAQPVVARVVDFLLALASNDPDSRNWDLCTCRLVSVKARRAVFFGAFLAIFKEARRVILEIETRAVFSVRH